MKDSATQEVGEEIYYNLLKGVVRSSPVRVPSENPNPKEITCNYLNRAQMMFHTGDKYYHLINLWQKEFNEGKPIQLVKNVEELDKMAEKILWFKSK